MPTAPVSKKTLLLALVASFVLAFGLQGHTLWTPLLITDDIAQHHVWLDAGEGSGFLPADPWVSASKVIQPYVTAALFEAFRLVLPTLLVGKVIALLMASLTGFLVFAIGGRLGGKRLGSVAAGLYFISDAWIGMSGGFARSFAWPLVCGFILALLDRRFSPAALCLFLSAVLYPIVFVLLAPAYAMVWLAEESRTGWRQTFNARAQLRAQWPLLLAVAAGGTLVLLKSREIAQHPHLGPQVLLAQILEDPVYGPGGRVQLWPSVPVHLMLPWTLLPWDKALLEPVMRHAGGLGGMVRLVAPLAAMVVFVLGIVILQRRRRGDAMILVAVAVAGMVTFELAELLLPKLYESSRYLVWSMPILGVLIAAVVLDAAIARVPSVRGRQVACVVVAVGLLSRAPTIRGKGAEDMSDYAPLYTALVHTGGGEVIASFPRTGDLVPVLCHRSIFISHESSHAVLFSRYKDLVMRRQAAQLKAFYSAQAGDVRAFCKDNDISWLVVEEKYYRQDMPTGVLFVPFEQQLRGMLEQTPEPWLLTYARKSGKQVQPGVYLLNTGPILDAPEQP